MEIVLQIIISRVLFSGGLVRIHDMPVLPEARPTWERDIYYVKICKVGTRWDLMMLLNWSRVRFLMSCGGRSLIS